MADVALTGVLHGNTITLDAPVPPLEGRRVLIIIAAEGHERVSTPDEQGRLWDDWVWQCPQGPIEDDGGSL